MGPSLSGQLRNPIACDNPDILVSQVLRSIKSEVLDDAGF